MLLELKSTMEKSRNFSLRRAAILKTEMDKKTYLFIIKNFLTKKYNLETVDKETLKNTQYKFLNNEINIKHEHKKLFRVTENERLK